MNKKKLLTLALVIVLIAILSFTTLAWFTDTDEVTNTFTVGSVKIVQNEQQIDDKTGALEDFEQGKMLLPIVNTKDPAADPNYQDKIVTVTSTGNNDAYVRTWIAIPKALVDYLVLDLNTVTEGEGWYRQETPPTTTVDGIEYVCYCFVYTPILTPGATTPAVLNGVYLDALVDIKDNPETESTNREFCKWNSETNACEFSGFEIANAAGQILSEVNVLVATQAVQAQGFADAHTALNSAFGEPAHETSVPWYVAPANP